MKAMSVRAPWAWLFFDKYFNRVSSDKRYLDHGDIKLFCHSPKDVENRTERSPIVTHLRKRLIDLQRGNPNASIPVLIHACKTLNDNDEKWCEKFGLHFLPKAHVLGAVDVYDVRLRPWQPPEERYKPSISGFNFSPWHQVGLVGIYVRNPRLLVRPLACRGQQGLFDVPDDELEFTAEKVSA